MSIHRSKERLYLTCKSGRRLNSPLGFSQLLATALLLPQTQTSSFRKADFTTVHDIRMNSLPFFRLRSSLSLRAFHQLQTNNPTQKLNFGRSGQSCWVSYPLYNTTADAPRYSSNGFVARKTASLIRLCLSKTDIRT